MTVKSVINVLLNVPSNIDELIRKIGPTNSIECFLNSDTY